jgi:hypothetical protein
VEPTAEQIAAAARARGPELAERIRLEADALVDALGHELELVAWDREQLVGQVQARVAALQPTRPPVRGGPPVRVVERRLQPLEAIDRVWGFLRRGRRVRLEQEPDACSGAATLLRGLAYRLPAGALEIHAEGGPSPAPPPGHVAGGVDPPAPRVAVIDAAADRELAAYVLARTGLRRSGMDPRGVKQAFAVGEVELLERHMRRLWVGVSVGPADDPESFAGPVPAALRDRFEAAHALWHEHEGVRTWCPGGVLQRTGDPATYLAPALFSTAWPPPPLPLVGPMVVVVVCSDEAQLQTAVRRTRDDGGEVMQIGGRPGRIPGPVRHVRGALLIERLPPGMPEPRPV